MKLFPHYAIKRSLQANVHGFMVKKRTSIHCANWSKTAKCQPSCNLLSSTATTFWFWGIFHRIKHLWIVCWRFQKCSVCIERFHSRGQHLCKFIGTKESVSIRKEFNSHRIGLGHQHGRLFIDFGHQYGRRDVMWKHAVESIVTVKRLKNGRDQHQVLAF